MSKENWSPEQYRQHKPPKKSKYRNEKVVVDGIEFDSKKEAKRYGELQVRLKAREISELELQPVFSLIVYGTLVCKYKADFKYIEEKDNRLVVEDCKGMRTKDYRIKAKLFFACYGYKIYETRKTTNHPPPPKSPSWPRSTRISMRFWSKLILIYRGGYSTI